MVGVSRQDRDLAMTCAFMELFSSDQNPLFGHVTVNLPIRTLHVVMHGTKQTTPNCDLTARHLAYDNLKSTESRLSPHLGHEIRKIHGLMTSRQLSSLTQHRLHRLPTTQTSLITLCNRVLCFKQVYLNYGGESYAYI